VTLVDFVERMDVEANGNFFKQQITKAKKWEHETANSPLDEVVFDVKLFQNND